MMLKRKKLSRSDVAQPSTYIILKEAESRGIRIENPCKKTPFTLQKKFRISLLSYKKHQEILIGQRIAQTSYAAYEITNNKILTKSFLKKNKIVHPPCYLHTVSDKKQVIPKKFYPLVIKPLNGSHGEGVHMNITQTTEAKKVIKNLFCKYKNVMVEPLIEGTEVRIFATRKKAIAAVHRKPANVVGDGKNTLKKLVEQKNNEDKRVYSQGELVLVPLDDLAQDIAQKQGYTPNDVPEKEQLVYLRNASNKSQGGDTIDVTDKLHTSYMDIAVQAVRSIPSLPYAGVDIIIKDFKKPANYRNYSVIELNSSPGIDIHHMPYVGKPRNVASHIVDIMFPETAS